MVPSNATLVAGNAISTGAMTSTQSNVSMDSFKQHGLFRNCEIQNVTINNNYFFNKKRNTPIIDSDSDN